MNTIEVDILNPKAGKLLNDLAELNLIAIRSTSDDGFLGIVRKLREKAANNPPAFEDITKEVEAVRIRRYASKSKN